MRAPLRMFLVTIALVIPQGVPAGTGSGEAGARAVAFVPETEGTGAPELEGDAWIAEGEGWGARLRLLDDAARQAYLRSHAKMETDPFVASREHTGGFLSFLLEIENRGGGSLVFQPQRCRLQTSKIEFRYPLDLPSIQSAYEMFDREMPPAYRGVRRALFDGEMVLPPGGRGEGLLVYPAPEPRAKRVEIEILLTTPAGESVGFSAPYRRPGKSRKSSR